MKDRLLYIKHNKYLKKYNKRQQKIYMECSHTDTNEERADYVLGTAAHTIEKGLGTPNKKMNFGEEKAFRICGLIEDYIEKDFDQSKYGFKEACAVLEEYLKYKREHNEKIEELEKRLEDIKNKTSVGNSDYQAGGTAFDSEQLMCNNPEKIKEFLKKCHSIRNYDKRKVSENDIKEAINIANCSPSACNRQPTNVYYTIDDEKIARVDELVPGNSTIKGETPNFLVVTTKKTHFGLYEYNQWYVNGGIFAGYLRIALNSLNIANCIYQWPIDGDEESLRDIYGIPESEEIICIFGIGYYDKESYCLKAQRKNMEK